MQSCLITGGAGFIGSHVAERFLKEGCKVRILDDLSSGKLENLSGIKDKIEIIEGDVRNIDAVKKAMTGIDCVSHHAAVVSVPVSMENPKMTLDINAAGTLNVLMAAREAGTKKIILASSSAVYGDTSKMPVAEEETVKPLSPYAVSKILSEYYCSAYSDLYGIDAVLFRYFNVFGTRQDPSSPYSGAVAKFSSLSKAGKDIEIYGDGMQTRDFISVSRVAQANYMAMKADLEGCHVFNVGNGKSTTIKDLAAGFIKINGSQSRIVTKEARSGDIRYSLANITKLQKTLGWQGDLNIEEELKDI